MNYSELEGRLGELKLESTLGSLRTAVREEALALLDLKPGRRTPKAIDAARSDAENFYAEEISAQLVEPRALTPNDVLSYRRRATAWAIAEKIREASR